MLGSRRLVARKNRSGSGRSASRSGRPGAARTKNASAAPRVHLYLAASLDGYIAAPDGGAEWLNPYGDARARFLGFIQTIGSVVMGRTTYDHALAKGYADFGQMPTYVMTHRPLSRGGASVIPFSDEPEELVRSIRERHRGDIWLMGGGRLTRSFADADLIDIWSIAVVPTLLGAGIPLFPTGELAERRLALVRTRKYPSGVIELRYERRPGASRRRARAGKG
jgi:dihydrofolate reductase